MPDLLYLLATVAFFAVAAALVAACDRIIGPDADHGDPQGVGDPELEPVLEVPAEATPAGAVR